MKTIISFSNLIRLLTLTLILAFFLFGTNKALATSGCCSWHGGVAYCDSSVGTYVCNDGTYSPSCGCYRAPPPPPPPPQFPKINASWNSLANTNGTYDISIVLNDNSPTRYSVTLNKVPRSDPGPLVDYTSPSFAFKNVYPGTWYLNAKKDINNVWSTVSYWTIIVPAWVAPTPTSTPIDTPTPTPIIDTSTNKKSQIILFFEWLFGLVSNKNAIVSAPAPTPTHPYTCNCAKTCTQISTCAEAYYQLDNCGCSIRDGDNDGIPCENLCR
ncbi:MAG: excalibur calcium-binding domain-containing protein [Candidatus Levybacteria bacterium]|nr:excalibur calcium-binding domain-containing protein [Candidatus Levybacteria bacterium]